MYIHTHNCLCFFLSHRRRITCTQVWLNLSEWSYWATTIRVRVVQKTFFSTNLCYKWHTWMNWYSHSHSHSHPPALSHSFRFTLHHSESPYDVFSVNANESAHVTHSLTRCKRQSSSTSSSSAAASVSMKKYPREINLTFSALGETFKLHLQKSSNLLTNQFTVREEVNTIYPQQLTSPAIDCFYQGYLTSHVNTSAAISLCNGIVSMHMGLCVVDTLSLLPAKGWRAASLSPPTARIHRNRIGDFYHQPTADATYQACERQMERANWPGNSSYHH